MKRATLAELLEEMRVFGNAVGRARYHGTTAPTWPASFAGKTIEISSELPIVEAVRKLRPRAWHDRAGCYPARVRKKWRKRFGTRPAVHALFFGGTVQLSEAAFREVQKLQSRSEGG